MGCNLNLKKLRPNALFSIINSKLMTLYSIFSVIPRSIRIKYQKIQMNNLQNKIQNRPSYKGKIVFWVPGGMPLMLHIEGAIATALLLSGYDVHMIICDGPYHACIKREIYDSIKVYDWSMSCRECKKQTNAILDFFNIPHSFIGDYITESERKKLWDLTETYTWDSLDELWYKKINLEKNVRSAIFRYLKGNDITGHEDIIREYAYSAVVCANAANNACTILKPDKIFMSTGTYVDFGPALKMAFDKKIPVTAWMASYLNARFYFRNLDPSTNLDFHNVSEKYWNEWKRTTVSSNQRMRLTDYLDKRYCHKNSFDMKKLSDYSGVQKNIRKKYGFNKKKPIWGIFCHINWDSVSDYSPMAYTTFNDWIIDTIREIITIDKIQWLVKIHPAESWDNPDSGIQQLIEKNFPQLPDHIHIIRFDEEINPLDFYNLIDGGVTVYGTPGLELAFQGKPVILAGEAHYGCKGFTYDGLSQESYKQLLRQAVSFKPLDKDQLDLAQRYAYSYFIQRQIPIPVVKNPNSTWWEFQFNKRELLLPGKDPFMDFVCEKIISGEDFIMDEKLVQLAENF